MVEHVAQRPAVPPSVAGLESLTRLSKVSPEHKRSVALAVLQFPVPTPLPPLSPFSVPPALSLFPFISLFYRNLAPSYFQLTKWEPVRREGNGGSARGKKEGAARGREGMLYAYLAITLATLLPFLTFLSLSRASRGRQLIVKASVSAARTQALRSRPGERRIQRLRPLQEREIYVRGGKN